LSLHWKLPDLDHVASDEWNGDAIPLCVDSDVSRGAAGMDDPTACASGEDVEAGIPLS
jgi:hypothetical protein